MGDVKPTDREGVIGKYQEAAQGYHDYKNDVMADLMKLKNGMEVPPERQAEMSAKLEQWAKKTAALERLAKFAHDPEKAAPYFEAQDRGDKTLPAHPEDPFDISGTPRPALDAAPREFFKNPEVKIKPLGTDKLTAEDIRHQWVGSKNEQVARGNQLAEAFRKAVPDELQRQGAAWFLDAGGDRDALEHMLEEAKQARANEGMDPAHLDEDNKNLAEMAGFPDSNLSKYVEQIEAALNLEPKTQKWVDTAGRYYSEAADVGQETGVLRTARENYVNRIYAPEKAQDFVKTELAGVKPSTSHSLRRTYDTMADAARAGKSFATTDLADLLSVHNEEMARAVSSRAMADAMAEAGLGAWKRSDNVPQGWAQVGSLEKRVPLRGADGKAVLGDDGNQMVSHSVFVAPEGIAKGLGAIADPNFVKKIDALRGIARYQGLVKTVDLSFSFFHHLSMAAQLAYNGDLAGLMKVGNLDKFLTAPDFAEREQEFVKHGGVTSVVDANMDILRQLTRDEGDTFSRIVNAPGVKQILKQTDKNAAFLFGKVQRLWKVDTFSKLAANWVADHGGATPEEHVAAMRGFAQHVNDRFGGQNWEAMGLTKSNLSLMRIGMLAPDWTVSNLHMLKAAIGEGGTGGKAARVHVLSSLVVGMAATEGLNHLLTGHFTDENDPGHKLEVEISPGVYVSLLRGGVQDITKLASMVAESGLAGVSRFSQGKLSPFARTGVGLLTNTQYTGQAIVPRNAGPVAGTYEVLKYALGSATPVPLGITNLLSYLQNEEPTATGVTAVATGVGRYSRGGTK